MPPRGSRCRADPAQIELRAPCELERDNAPAELRTDLFRRREAEVSPLPAARPSSLYFDPSSNSDLIIVHSNRIDKYWEQQRTDDIQDQRVLLASLMRMSKRNDGETEP
jgi:hypothetical protein